VLHICTTNVKRKSAKGPGLRGWLGSFRKYKLGDQLTSDSGAKKRGWG